MKNSSLGVGIHNLGFPINRFKRFAEGGPSVGGDTGGQGPGGLGAGGGFGMGSGGFGPSGGGPQSAVEADAASRAARAGAAHAAAQAAAQAASAPASPSTSALFSGDPDFGQALDARSDLFGGYQDSGIVDVQAPELSFPLGTIDLMRQIKEQQDFDVQVKEQAFLDFQEGTINQRDLANILSQQHGKFGIGVGFNNAADLGAKTADDAGLLTGDKFDAKTATDAQKINRMADRLAEHEANQAKQDLFSAQGVASFFGDAFSAGKKGLFGMLDLPGFFGGAFNRSPREQGGR